MNEMPQIMYPTYPNGAGIGTGTGREELPQNGGLPPQNPPMAEGGPTSPWTEMGGMGSPTPRPY